MLYRLGRFLQFAGLLVLPIALAGNAADKLDLKQMLAIAAGGMTVFFAGVQIQQLGKP